MFEGLFSSEAQFTRGFTAIAHHGAAAASLLRDALRDRSKRTASLTAIKHLVKESGATAHDLRVRVARTLVTPLDREDIGLLVSRLEGVLRSVERSAAIVLVASALLAPLCWLHYAPILLIPAAAWLRGR